MQAYFGERAHFDLASAILDLNSEEAWGETKRHPQRAGVRLKKQSPPPRRPLFLSQHVMLIPITCQGTEKHLHCRVVEGLHRDFFNSRKAQKQTNKTRSTYPQNQNVSTTELSSNHFRGNLTHGLVFPLYCLYLVSCCSSHRNIRFCRLFESLKPTIFYALRVPKFERKRKS